MSEEETKVEAATEAPATEGSTTEEAAPKKKGKKWSIVVGVVVVVLIAAGAGFWVWHEQPSFCAAICHTPMDEYLETYEQEPGTTGVDKWGNEVSNTNAMLAVSHKAQGKDCMSCHVPTLSEQMSEGINWVTGNYVYPLEERDTDMLTEARGLDARRPREGYERYGVQPAQGAARRDRVQRVPQGAPRFCDVLHAVPQRGRSARGLADGCRGQQAFDCGVSH